MYEDFFRSLNLNEHEAAVYELLLNLGASPVREILKKTPALKRSNLYNVLNGLKQAGLVDEKLDKNGVTLFYPESPDKLEPLIAEQEKKLSLSKSQFSTQLPALKNLFMLTQERPAVRFFDGRQGIEKVALDSLTSKTEILSYLDPPAIDQHLKNFNLDYKKQRRAKNIFKKMLVADTPALRARYQNLEKDITAARFMDEKITPFQGVMQIYDNKISYITLTEKNMIGVIIEDAAIYQMHRAIFEYNWRMSRE